MERSTHVDSKGRPGMVDLGMKPSTYRTAVAQGRVLVPWTVDQEGLEKDEEWISPKGPVIQTAVLAGIGGAKETSRLIPLCHPLSLTFCGVQIEPRFLKDQDLMEFTIRCTAKTYGPTGVEMEALSGVSAAALTLYDMGKSVVQGIRIADIHLVLKTGGRHDVDLQSL